MAYGIRIIGDDSTTQIDENYICLARVAKGSGVATTLTFERAAFATVIVSGGTMPLLVLRVTSSASNRRGGTIISMTKVGNDWHFLVLIYDAFSTDYSFDFYIFDQPPTSIDSSGYGFIVRNASNQVVFNSNWPAMSVAHSTTAGRTYAALLTSSVDYQENYYYDSVENTDVYTFNYSIQVAGFFNGALQVNYANVFSGVQRGQPPHTGYEYHGFTQNPLLIDVTNQ